MGEKSTLVSTGRYRMAVYDALDPFLQEEFVDKRTGGLVWRVCDVVRLQDSADTRREMKRAFPGVDWNW